MLIPQNWNGPLKPMVFSLKTGPNLILMKGPISKLQKIIKLLAVLCIEGMLQLLDIIIASSHRHDSWCQQIHSGQGGAGGCALHRQRQDH